MSDTQANPYLSATPEFSTKGDYHICSFWEDNHPLSAVGAILSDDIPISGESEDPVIEVYRLTTNCYYDLYNNGGGNEGYWKIKASLKKALKKAFGSEIKKLIMDDFKSILEVLSGSYQVRSKHEALTFKRMELFRSNVTYFCAKAKNLPLPAVAEKE